MIKAISFLITISNPNELIAVPIRQNIVNSFDYNAAVVGVERNKNENNIDLKNKIYDASVHPAGPTYDGIISSLSRAFGYVRKSILKIELKTNSSGDFIATAPRIDFLANKVVLYKVWNPSGNNTTDKEIKIYNQEDSGYFLSGLISEINSSECYLCSLVNPIRLNTHSSSLIRGTSHRFFSSDTIKEDYRSILTNKNIINGTVVFDDKYTFATETTSTPSNTGEYKIDYKNGTVISFVIPDIESSCSYHYNVFPYIVDYSPVQIYNMNDDNFINELYNKETTSSGEVKTLPNKEGVEILEKIFKSKIFWGE